MIKEIQKKDIEEIKTYIDELQKIYNDINENGYAKTKEEEDKIENIIIEGYEKKARPCIEILDMHDPKSIQPGEKIINYNNDAELCTIWFNYSHLNKSIIFLKRVKARMERYLTNPEEFKKQNNVEEFENSLTKVIDLLNRFHSLIKSLTKRRKGKQDYEISDEYDVQDLLYCIIKSHFKYADREEPASSVGKGTTVIDIVIPEYNIVIEIKLIKDSAKEKEIVKQLKIDFESYHTHKACQKLIAFIYDPNTVIKDPGKIINDLSGKRTKGNKSFDVIIVINPK